MTGPFKDNVETAFPGGLDVFDAGNYDPAIALAVNALEVVVSGMGVTVPNVVADGGKTDNYSTIQAFVDALPHGGIVRLPAGVIGVGTAVTPPIGVTLAGSGSSNSPGSTIMYGTTLVPTYLGQPTAVVDLANELTSLQDINVLGINPSTSTQSTYAVSNEGSQCNYRNVGIYGGSTAALFTTSGALQCHMTDCFIRGEGGTTYSWNHGGVDWEVANVNCANAPANIGGGTNRFVNVHFNLGPGGSGSSPLLTDLGSNFYTSCYFDTVLPGGSALIDRTSANAPSHFIACTYFQGSTTELSGVPCFLECQTANHGAVIVGGVGINPTNGSTFTNFIHGAIASTVCVGVSVPSTFLSSTFTDNTQPPGTLANNIISGVPYTNTTGWTFGGAVVSVTAPFALNSRIAVHATVQQTSNYATSTSDFWVRMNPASAANLTLTNGTDTVIFATNESSTGTVTVLPGSGTISGSASTTITSNNSAIFVCDGTNWHVMGVS